MQKEVPLKGRYRLTEPTLAMVAVDGHHTSLIVPTDTVIDLDGKTFNGDRLTEVLWEGRKVLMFTSDLKMSTVPA
jgi:hypothetical protein